MNKQTESKVFAQIDDLLMRWRKELTSPTPNKPEMAEEGINLYYKKAGKKPPLILWCDSPLQTMLIPTLVSNVLRSNEWKKLLATMKDVSSLDEERYDSLWKSQLAIVRKTVVDPMIDRIWKFQFPNETTATQHKLLDRLSEHLFAILKDGRLTPENILPKNSKQTPSGYYQAPAHFDMWTKFTKLSAEIERRTTAEFRFNVTTAQGMFLGVIDHRAITKNIPVVNDLLSPNEQQKELLTRVQHVRSKCAELERIATSRAALLTQAAAGFQRPALVPNVDPTVDFKKEWKEMMWKNFEEVKRDTELRLSDPRANGMIFWGVNASWLPLALCSRLLDTKFLADLEDDIDSWAYMFHGAAGYYLGDQVCFVCRNPKTLITNDSGQLHCAFGAAATWNDGFDIHCWRGLLVDPDLIKRAHEVTIQQVLGEKNAETRRILLDMFGDERFIRESGATIVNKDKCGVLYRYTFESDEPLQMVKVRNSTRELDGSYKDYYLRVPPNVTTAHEAVAWTFGLTSTEYQPEFES